MARLAIWMFWYEPRMWILESARTIRVLVTFSMVNLVRPPFPANRPIARAKWSPDTSQIIFKLIYLQRQQVGTVSWPKWLPKGMKFDLNHQVNADGSRTHQKVEMKSVSQVKKLKMQIEEACAHLSRKIWRLWLRTSRWRGRRVGWERERRRFRSRRRRLAQSRPPSGCWPHPLFPCTCESPPVQKFATSFNREKHIGPSSAEN